MAQSHMQLMRSICQLYGKSVIRLLPLTIMVTALYHFVLLGQNLFPGYTPALHTQVAMMILVLIIPIKGAMIVMMNDISKNTPSGVGAALYIGFARILSLLGSIVSIILVPAIILGLGVAVYFVLNANHMPMIVLISVVVVTALIIFALVVNRLFAPFLVYTDNLDANESVDVSVNLVKGHYWRTVMFTLYAVILLVMINLIPMCLVHFVPALQTVSDHVLQLAADLGFIIFAPWAMACMLGQLYSLQSNAK